MIEQVRDVVRSTGFLGDRITTLPADADLYELGMTSFASVQLMLALEDAFDVEFPERMLNRRTFASLGAIAAALAELSGEKV
jgi:acyl carrier protein